MLVRRLMERSPSSLTYFRDIMTPPPPGPRTSDDEAAVRIALVREMTEAARAGAIRWEVRDRRLRALFGVRESSRAFDSTRPCYT